MRYLRPDIHNIFKLFTLQFIIIVAIILGAFRANAFSQNSITTPPNALEQRSQRIWLLNTFPVHRFPFPARNKFSE